MWDWERASVPFQPIYRRRLWRRRFLVLLAALAIAVPYLVIHQLRAATPIGAQVFDDVTTAISMRYFDASYHGVDWSALKREYRPLVAAAPTTARRYALLREMLHRLGDSHTAVYSPADLAEHRIGPGVGVDRSPRATNMVSRTVVRHGVYGMVGDDAPVTSDAASPIEWRALSRDVGYLRLGSFPNTVEPLLGWAMAEVGSKPKLILDLRGNPGGLVDSVDSVAGVFLPRGSLVSSGLRRYHFFGPQRFEATNGTGVHYDGRLVVLVDGNSRSGAESLARALQYYHRALIVGSRTAGKVLGVDLEINLPDGGLLRVATLDMRSPDGERLEGRGVIPDLDVAGDQTQMQTALALLKAKE